MSEDETEERRRVWVALSDLFLDTELDEAWLDRITEVLVESGFSWPELDRIFRLEVAPALGPILHPTAGEWRGFAPEAVCAEVRGRRRVATPLDRLAAKLRLRTWMAEESWRAVKRRFDSRRPDA